MKKFWKLLAAIMGIALVFSFVGCSSDDDDESDTPAGGGNEVVGETMPLIINLDETCAVPGGSVTVTYGHNRDTEDTSDDVFTTTTATLNTTGTVATANLLKSYAYGDELWYNNTVITVKDASGTEIKTTYTMGSVAYFKYNAAGVILYITKYSSEPKDLTITFTNLGTVAAGTVTYGASEKEEDSDSLVTVAMTIAEDGLSATAPINPDKCQENGWFYIAEIKVYSDADKATEIEVDDITYATDEGKAWMDVNNIKAVTLSKDADEKIEFPYKNTFTVEAEKYTKILPASALKDKNVAYILVKIESETESAWAALSGASTYTKELYLANCINTTTIIDDETLIKAVKENGLYVQTSAGEFSFEVNYSETALTGSPMKVVLSFAENIGATSVTANYWLSTGSKDESAGKDFTVTDNKVEIEIPFTSAWGYNATITVKDSSSQEITDIAVSGVTSTPDSVAKDAGSEPDLSKYWFPFVEDSTLTVSYAKADEVQGDDNSDDDTNQEGDDQSGGETITFPYTVEYTGTGDPVKIIDGSAVGTYTAITVVASNIDWKEYTGDDQWMSVYSDTSWSNALSMWSDSSNKKADIKSGDEWSGALFSAITGADGALYVATKAGVTCTLTVSLWNQ